MKVAVVGITGMSGRAIADCLLVRGHEVTGICRNPHRIEARHCLTLVAADALQQEEIAAAIAGHEVVVNGYSAGHQMELRVYKETIEQTRRMIRAARDHQTPYLIHVGGAASLYVRPGVQMLEDPRFPIWYFRVAPPEHLEWLAELIGLPIMRQIAADRRQELADPALPPFQSPARQDFEQHLSTASDFSLLEGCRVSFDLYVNDRSIQWTFLSPPWLYRPGPATGRYRTVIDELPMAGDIPASISVGDLALAVADECEQRQFRHRHWSVAHVG